MPYLKWRQKVQKLIPAETDKEAHTLFQETNTVLRFHSMKLKEDKLDSGIRTVPWMVMGSRDNAWDHMTKFTYHAECGNLFNAERGRGSRSTCALRNALGQCSIRCGNFPLLAQ